MEIKTCGSCKRPQPISEFNRQAKSRDGFQNYCRSCQRDHKYRSRYGIGAEEVAAMFSAQGGSCAICDDPLNKFHIDHDHSTGVVRGLLCGLCNHMLGQARDNPEILRRAAGYVERMKR